MASFLPSSCSRSSYGLPAAPFTSFDSDTNLSHLLGEKSQIPQYCGQFDFCRSHWSPRYCLHPHGRPQDCTAAPTAGTGTSNKKTLQEITIIFQANINSNSHYMAQNPFLATPRPGHRYKHFAIYRCLTFIKKKHF